MNSNSHDHNRIVDMSDLKLETQLIIFQDLPVLIEQMCDKMLIVCSVVNNKLI